LLEEQTPKIMRGKYLGDAAVVASDEEEVGATLKAMTIASFAIIP
jgi:hypothetical protein